MGLFNLKSKREAAENFVRTSLSKLPIIDDIIFTAMQSEKSWIKERQGYYDNGRRQVIVEKDLIQIRWGVQYNGENADKEPNDSFNLTYTSAGYVPLHRFAREEYSEVSERRVLAIFISIILERMKKVMPNCIYGEITDYENFSSFTYTLPRLKWKEWF